MRCLIQWTCTDQSGFSLSLKHLNLDVHLCWIFITVMQPVQTVELRGQYSNSQEELKPVVWAYYVTWDALGYLRLCCRRAEVAHWEYFSRSPLGDRKSDMSSSIQYCTKRCPGHWSCFRKTIRHLQGYDTGPVEDMCLSFYSFSQIILWVTEFHLQCSSNKCSGTCPSLFLLQKLKS